MIIICYLFVAGPTTAITSTTTAPTTTTPPVCLLTEGMDEENILTTSDIKVRVASASVES